MKVIGIIEDNHITGVQYGLIEIPDPVEHPSLKQAKNYQIQMKKLQNKIQSKQRIYHTRQK